MMAAFKVTVTVSDAELGRVLAGFSRKQIAEADIVPIKEVANGVPVRAPASVPTGRAAGMAIVMKGERTDVPSGRQAYLKTVLTLHEKLEAKKGIGSITRGDLTKEAKAKVGNFRAAHISALIEGGWLTYVTGD